MIFKNLNDKIYRIGRRIPASALLLCMVTVLSGCTLVTDEPVSCPEGLNIDFTYTYNLQKGEAFPSQVKSVYVWAFDKSGACVWHGEETGEALEKPGFFIATPLGEGTYDFVVWGGLNGNADFSLATYKPASKKDLEIKLNMKQDGGEYVSASHLPGLFHGKVENIIYKPDPRKPSVQTLTIPLVKDTNDIVVMLVNENGNPLDVDNFTVRFNYADSYLAWDNAVMANSPLVTYQPWSFLYGETSGPAGSKNGDETRRSTIMYELSTSRLMAGGNAYLDVYRNDDDKRIIHLPLIEYFVLEKGNRYKEYTDQEYLDRRDDYSAVFFLDSNNDWNLAAGIYINGWAVVPPQPEDM